MIKFQSNILPWKKQALRSFIAYFPSMSNKVQLRGTFILVVKKVVAIWMMLIIKRCYLKNFHRINA